MKRLVPVTLLLAISALPVTLASCAGEKPKRTPIRPVSNCMDISRNPEIYVLDDRTVIAKTGPNNFRINLVNKCTNLKVGTPTFEVAMDKRVMSRLCGESGDMVITTSGLRCAVLNVQPVNADEFKRLEAMSMGK